MKTSTDVQKNIQSAQQVQITSLSNPETSLNVQPSAIEVSHVELEINQAEINPLGVNQSGSKQNELDDSFVIVDHKPQVVFKIEKKNEEESDKDDDKDNVEGAKLLYSLKLNHSKGDSPKNSDQNANSQNASHQNGNPQNGNSQNANSEGSKEIQAPLSPALNPLPHPMSVIDALSVLLVQPIDGDYYRNALKILSEVKKVEEKYDQYLKLIFEHIGELPVYKNVEEIPSTDFPIDKSILKNLPNLFKPELEPMEYDLIDNFLRKLADDNLLSEPFVLQYFQNCLAKEDATPIEELTEDKSRIPLTMIYVLLAAYFSEDSNNLYGEFSESEIVSKKNKKEHEELIRKQHERIKVVEARLMAYLCDESNSVTLDGFPAVLKAPVIRLKQYLSNHPNRSLRIETRNLCEKFKIPLDLPKLLSLSVDGIEVNTRASIAKHYELSNENMEKESKAKGEQDYPLEENLVLMIGPAGAGKSTLTNLLTGVKYRQVAGDTRLVPIAGQNISATVGSGWSSQTLYPQIIKGDEFVYVDLAGFKDTRDSDRGICATLGLPLTIDSLKSCTLHLLSEKDLPIKSPADFLPAFIKKPDGSYNILTNSMEGIKQIPCPESINRKAIDALYQSNLAARRVSLPWSDPIIESLTKLGHRNPKVAKCVVIVIPYNIFDPSADCGRENKIREIAVTLFNLFTDPMKLAENGNLVFALSKPPTPPQRNLPFDTKQLHRKFRDSLDRLRKEKKRDFCNLEIDLEDIKKLELNMSILQQSIKELKLLEKGLASKDGPKPEKSGWFLQQFQKIAGVKEVYEEGLISVFIEDQAQIWKKQSLSEECIELLKPAMRKILDPSKKGAQDQEITKQIEMLNTQYEKLKFERDTLKTKNDNDTALKKILDIIDVKVEGSNNVFIFRGYEMDPPHPKDQPDDCEKLKEHFRALRKGNSEIAYQQFKFNPKSPEFKRVEDWAKKFSKEINPKLDGLCTLPNALSNLKSDISRIKTEIAAQQLELKEQLTTSRSPNVGSDLSLMIEDQIPQDLESRFAPALVLMKNNEFNLIVNTEKGTKQIKAPAGYNPKSLSEFFDTNKKYKKIFLQNDHALMKWIINDAKHSTKFTHIEELKAKISEREVEIKKLAASVATLQSEIEINIKRKTAIEDEPPIEYKTKIFHELRSGPFWRCTSSSWTRSENEARIPIDRVELSCTLNNNGKLFIKSPISVSEECDNISGSITIGGRSKEVKSNIFLVEDEDTTPNGEFKLKLDDLPRGKFEIEYESKSGVDGDACVRVFVKPKYVAKYRDEIIQINDKIKNNDALIKKLNQQIEQEELKLKYDRYYLNLLESKMRLDQSENVFRIKTLLYFLGYEKDKFIADYMPDIDNLNWIEDKDNFEFLIQLKQLKKTDEKNLQKILGDDNVDARSYSMVISGSYDDTQSSVPLASSTVVDPKAKPAHTIDLSKGKTIPAGLFKSLMKFVNATGLSISSIHELLLWNFSFFEKDKALSLPVELSRYTSERNEKLYIFEVLRQEYGKYSTSIDALRKITGIFNFGSEVVGRFVEYCVKLYTHDNSLLQSQKGEVLTKKEYEEVLKTIKGGLGEPSKLNEFVDKYKLTLRALTEGQRIYEALKGGSGSSVNDQDPESSEGIVGAKDKDKDTGISTANKGEPGKLTGSGLDNKLSLMGSDENGKTNGSSKVNLGDIDTLPDGNCAINAVVLGVWALMNKNKPLGDLYKHIMDELKLGSSADSSSLDNPRAFVVKALSKLNIKDIQKTLAPLFRRWSIEYIVEHYDHYQESYENSLLEACQAFVARGEKDSNYCVHSFISDKFNSIKKDLIDRTKSKQEAKELELDQKAKDSLLKWWGKPKEGKKITKASKHARIQYFDTIKQAATHGAEFERWGSEVEIDAIACRLGITIKNVNQRTKNTQLLGIGYGLITPLKRDLAKHIESFQIGELTKGGIRLLTPNKKFIEKVFSISFSDPERKVLLDEGHRNKILAYRNQEIADPNLSGVDSLAALCNRLESIGAIKVTIKMENVKYQYVPLERLKLLITPVPDDLKKKLMLAHKSNPPTFEIYHSGRHWSYKGDSLIVQNGQAKKSAVELQKVGQKGAHGQDGGTHSGLNSAENLALNSDQILDQNSGKTPGQSNMSNTGGSHSNNIAKVNLLNIFFEMLSKGNLIASQIPANEKELGLILDRAILAANGCYLKFYKEADIKDIVVKNKVLSEVHAPSLIKNDNGTFNYIINGKQGVEKKNFSNNLSADKLNALFDPNYAAKQAYFTWEELQWLTLQGGHIAETNRDFALIKYLLSEIKKQGPLSKLPFKDGRNWLYYLSKIYCGPCLATVKEIIPVQIQTQISPFQRAEDGRNAFLNLPQGDPAALARSFRPGTLPDMIGVDKQKREIEDFVDRISKNPKQDNHFMLLVGSYGVGKTELIKQIMFMKEIKLREFKDGDRNDKYVGQIEARVQEFFEDAKDLGEPVCLLMDEMDAITPKYDGGSVPAGHHNPANINKIIMKQITQLKGTKVFLLGATNYLDRIDPAIVNRAGTPVNFELPDFNIRKRIIENILRNRLLEDHGIIQRLTEATTGWSPRLLKDYLDNVLRKSPEAPSVIPEARFIENFEEMRIRAMDLQPIPNFSGMIPPKLKAIGKMDFTQDLVGLNPAVKRELEKICAYLANPKAYHKVVDTQKTLLLYGPPGTGKTLFAKTVADYSNAVFFSVSAGKYKAGSLSELRKIFDEAKKYERSVIFIDEIDAISRRESILREELQTLLNGFEHKAKSSGDRVMVVLAATNHYDDIDPAVLRRFKEIEVPLPTLEQRIEHFKFYLGKKIDAIEFQIGMDWDELYLQLAQCTEQFSPDDICKVVSNAAETVVDFAEINKEESVLTEKHLFDACSDQRRQVSKRMKALNKQKALGNPLDLFGNSPMGLPTPAMPMPSSFAPTINSSNDYTDINNKNKEILSLTDSSLPKKEQPKVVFSMAKGGDQPLIFSQQKKGANVLELSDLRERKTDKTDKADKSDKADKAEVSDPLSVKNKKQM